MKKNSKTSYTLLLILMVTSFLYGCQSITPDKTSKNQEALQEINQSQLDNNLVNESTMPITDKIDLEIVPPPLPAEDRFDISVKEVDINSFLLGLVDSSDYNLIVSPELNQLVSLQLKDVTISEVLHALTKIYPIIVKQQGNLFFVSSAETMTAIYNIDYLNIKRSGDSKTSIAGQSISGGGNNNNNRSSDTQSQSQRSGNNVQQSTSSSVETKNETDFWSELTTSLNLMIKDEEKANIVVSPHAGIVVVRALPKTHDLIKNYLNRSQRSLNRQVIIEAKIIEVRLNDAFQSGIDWSKMGSVNGGDTFTIGQSGQVIKQLSTETPLNGIFSLLYAGESFTAAIELLKSQGDTQILSSPRVSTVNNQKAIIKVGSDEFFVTDVSTTTVTGTSTATTPNVTLTPFFSGISLDVTPQISSLGDIILHIHPIVSEVTDQPKTLSLGQDEFILPLALTNVRESDNIVRTKNGQVIVIGGLMQNTITEEVNSTVLLGDLPLIGNLFKQTRQYQVKSELVILLRAHLVDDSETNQELERIKNRFSEF